ncbi:response regulator [Flavobacterium sp.]|uniref:response regulator n=1 Tax=Flavobacterium sp. TaxID=239 RepID=UPI00261508CE|nr:response regulator [Flavobacterium sp.]
MTINVLIVDDHKLIIEGYKTIFSNNRLGAEIDVCEATTTTQAVEILKASAVEKTFDVVILDYTLPVCETYKIYNGFDLVHYVRTYQPQAKLMILTSHSEALILYRVIMESRAEAIMIKSDFSSMELLEAFENVYQGGTCYTKTVAALKQQLNADYKVLDGINRQMIAMLAQGFKTRYIMDHLGLSKSAIDKRKALIREYFAIEKGNDETIVQMARDRGYI